MTLSFQNFLCLSIVTIWLCDHEYDSVVTCDICDSCDQTIMLNPNPKEDKIKIKYRRKIKS